MATEHTEARRRGLDFRKLMRRYPTGVTVVTIRAGAIDHGMTANACTALSLDPLLFLVCVDHSARAHELIPEAGHFVVNLLARDQEHVCRTFAHKDLPDEERWAVVTTHPSSFGALRIDGCLGYLDCVLVQSYPGGDHTIFVGEVVEVVAGADKPPLVFHDGRYADVVHREPGG